MLDICLPSYVENLYLSLSYFKYLGLETSSIPDSFTFKVTLSWYTHLKIEKELRRESNGYMRPPIAPNGNALY